MPPQSPMRRAATTPRRFIMRHAPLPPRACQRRFAKSFADGADDAIVRAGACSTSTAKMRGREKCAKRVIRCARARLPQMPALPTFACSRSARNPLPDFASAICRRGAARDVYLRYRALDTPPSNHCRHYHAVVATTPACAQRRQAA